MNTALQGKGFLAWLAVVGCVSSCANTNAPQMVIVPVRVSHQTTARATWHGAGALQAAFDARAASYRTTAAR